MQPTALPQLRSRRSNAAKIDILDPAITDGAGETATIVIALAAIAVPATAITVTAIAIPVIIAIVITVAPITIAVVVAVTTAPIAAIINRDIARDLIATTYPIDIGDTLDVDIAAPTTAPFNRRNTAFDGFA